MRRATFTLVVAGVLGVAGGPAVIAESPDGTPLPSGQRFESPEHGIAVTMPAGWLNASDPPGPSLPIFESVIAAAPVDGPGRCAVETFAFDEVEPHKMAETLGFVGHYSEFEIREEQQLPEGSLRVRMYADEAPGGEPGASVAYVFEAEDGYAWLWCSTTESPPEDRWLSIAETFEFLPAEE